MNMAFVFYMVEVSILLCVCGHGRVCLILHNAGYTTWQDHTFTNSLPNQNEQRILLDKDDSGLTHSTLAQSSCMNSVCVGRLKVHVDSTVYRSVYSHADV